MPTAIASLGWFRNRGIAATPGYFISGVQWSGAKATTGDTFARTQQSTSLGGGVYYPNSNTQNSTSDEDQWVAAGTLKIAVILEASPNKAIASIQFDGVTKSTHDGYNAGTVANTYSEVTGIANTAGLKVVRAINATKHASSTGYGMFLQSYAIVRTGA